MQPFPVASPPAQCYAVPCRGSCPGLSTIPNPSRHIYAIERLYAYRSSLRHTNHFKSPPSCMVIVSHNGEGMYISNSLYIPSKLCLIFFSFCGAPSPLSPAPPTVNKPLLAYTCSSCTLPYQTFLSRAATCYLHIHSFSASFPTAYSPQSHTSRSLRLPALIIAPDPKPATHGDQTQQI